MRAGNCFSRVISPVIRLVTASHADGGREIYPIRSNPRGKINARAVNFLKIDESMIKAPCARYRATKSEHLTRTRGIGIIIAAAAADNSVHSIEGKRAVS